MSTPSILSINESVVAFSDTVITNNPRLKSFDWTRQINGIQVYSPKSEQFVVPARSSQSIFSGTRATTLDGTTSLALSFISGTKYRFTYSGVGTDPTFAADQAIVAAAGDATFTNNGNQTVTLTFSAGAPFTNVLAGAVFYVRKAEDGGTGVSALNVGEWVVLSKNSNASIVLARPEGTTYEATTETVVGLNPVNQFLAFTRTTVQVGDKVRINSPWALATRGTYTVEAVTSKWIDVFSSVPLAAETVLPTAAGMVFYTSGKRYVRVETDQNAKVYFNGSASENEEINPWVAGDASQMGWQERCGPVWSLSVANLSSVPMVVNVFSAE